MGDVNENIGRREFLVRSVKAGIAVAAAAIGSYILYDPKGPQKEKPGSANVILPDFSVKPVEGKTICIAKGPDRKQCVNAAISELGGMERFVKPGETVAIKPNIAFASSPDLGATSHPELIAELVRMCLKAGAKRVMVLDNPINDPASCYMLSGIEKAVTEAGGEIILPKTEYFKNISLKKGKLIQDWPFLFEPVKKADKLIGVAPVKSHNRSGASMSMKNWYGLLGGRRNIFHQDIHTIISELAQLVKPTLVVLDGFNVMMSNGPTGGSLSDLKNLNTIIASTDQVAADSFGSGLLNIDISNLPYIAMAEKAGAGISDYKSLKPLFVKAG
jgi:uncharacterized protein (DUF362 family)